MTSYGTQRSTSFSRELPDNAVMEHGKIYHAEFAVEGARTLLPGWENDVISTIRNSLYGENCEVTYLNIDSQKHSATVQYKLMDTANASAMAFPIVAVLAIVYVITVVVAIYLISLTLVGGVKELSSTVSDVISDNPLMTPVVYGAIAIAGIVALIYLKNQFTSSG